MENVQAGLARFIDRSIAPSLSGWDRVLVAGALRNSVYGADDEFRKLPPAVQRTVGSPSQLKEWALMDAETVQSVVASNFQRSFQVCQKREDDYQKLPGAVKSFIAELAGKMEFEKLPEGGGV